jgi:DNA repair protein RadD
MNLRYYQSDAITATYDYLRSHTGDPLIVIPTGGGKTPVIATIARDAVMTWGGRVLILSHVKELLEQSAKTIAGLAPGLDVGVYSAGLKSRKLDAPATVAGIQSIYKKAADLGPIDLCLIDEAHLIPMTGDGMYRQFLAEARIVNPNLRCVGLTATPYRMSTGLIYGEGTPFEGIAYEVGVRELIAKGFLSPLKSKRGLECDTSGLHLRGGEFIETEVQSLAMENVAEAVEELLIHTATSRKAVIVFAAGVDHATEIANRIAGAGFAVDVVTGEDEEAERAEAIARFRGERLCSICRNALPCRRLGHADAEYLPPLQYLVNVNVLTTGFDAPNVDGVALMRATASKGLYYQMVGRGFRLADGKTDCLVLDFGNNVETHGPVDQLTAEPYCPPGDRKARDKAENQGKCCPACKAIVALGYAKCPECGSAFEREAGPRHEATASDAEVISGGGGSGAVAEEWFEVFGTKYASHTKKGAPDEAPKTLRVDYDCGLRFAYSEWVCVEHPAGGYARGKAETWWSEMANGADWPESAADAADLGNAGAFRTVRRVLVRKTRGSKFPKIIERETTEPTAGAAEAMPWETPKADFAASLAEVAPRSLFSDDSPF